MIILYQLKANLDYGIMIKNELGDFMEIVVKTIKKDLEYLRQVSKPVDLSNNEYLNIIKKLREYVNSGDERVLAIASIQLGIPLRLIYVKKSDLNRLDEEYDESFIMINPVIKSRVGLTRFYECCASCMDYMGLVERPYKIEVEYYKEDKTKCIDTYEGFIATVLSHEIDHLDGILHTDKSIELYDMPFDKRKEFRKTHEYEIIKKTGKFKPTTKKYKSIKEAIKY